MSRTGALLSLEPPSVQGNDAHATGELERKAESCDWPHQVSNLNLP